MALFLYFILLNIYFRFYIFILNKESLWHWRLPALGVLNDVVAAGVFFLCFQLLWILIRKQNLRKWIFFISLLPWVLLNYVNYQYIATFNKILPLAWFHEFWVNKNAMGSYGSFIKTLLDFAFFSQIIIPIIVTLALLRWSPRFLKLGKWWYLPVIILLSVAAQSSTLDPDIQPIWNAPVQNQILKYWYYDWDVKRMPEIRRAPISDWSTHFEKVVWEKPASDSKLLPDIKKKKPNVVLLMLESFRSFEIGAFGSKLGLTPHFDRFTKEGVLFTNLYSSGHLTKNGQWALLCSGMKNSAGPVLTYYPDSVSKCLPDYLAESGYENWWFHGQSAAYDRQGYFMQKHQVHHIMDRLSFPSGSEILGWGLSDEALVDHTLNHLSEMKEPFFLNVQTQSNHHPYEVPDSMKKDRGYEDLTNRFLNSFQYTDLMIAKFLDAYLKTPKGKNSLIILVADHGNGKPLVEKDRIEKMETLHRFQVPMLLIYPEEEREGTAGRINTLGAQVDVMPTLMDILDIKEDYPLLGKSLIRDYQHRYARGLIEGSWLIVDEKVYFNRPSKVKKNLNGDTLSTAEGDHSWFTLMAELDDLQDWMVQQRNQKVIRETLNKKVNKLHSSK